MRTHQYRYVFADIATGRAVAALPLRKVAWDRRISSGDSTEPGTLQAQLIITDADVAAKARRVLGRDQSPHAVHVWRDNTLVWSGFVTGRSPVLSGDTEYIDVKAESFEGYLAHRLLREDLALSGPGQSAMNTLWAQVQNPAGGDVRVASGAAGGVGIDRDWLSGAGVWYSDVAADIAADGGFEWVIDWSRSPTTGLYSGVLRFGSPLGQSTRPHAFYYVAGRPGNSITGWSLPQELTESAGTAAQAIGGKDPDLSANVAAVVPPAMSSVHDSPLLSSGLWLRTDVQVQLSDEQDQAVLEDAAAGLLAGGPWSGVPEVSVDLDRSTFEPGSIGDYARYVIRGGLLSVDVRIRTIGLSVEVRDDGTETARLLYQEEGV